MNTLKYILVILLFLLSFLSVWGSDNINYDINKLISDHFVNCPKNYMNNLLHIRKSKTTKKGNTSNQNALKFLDIETNKFGSEVYTENYPKEFNYNFSIPKK